jgi:hypothetical protein
LRIRLSLAAGLAAVVALAASAALSAADGPVRKPLASDERAALLALIKAVDLAQDSDVVSTIELPWSVDVLKSLGAAYVPFRLALGSLPEAPRSAAMYVRVVSRHDGYRSKEESSSLREWAMRGGAPPPDPLETVVFNPGELPIGGTSVRSARRSMAAPSEASAILSMQEKAIEKERAAAEEERRRAETPWRDPYRFPFEEYYFFDAKPGHVERALAVPPGEYDVFVGLVDRARVKTTTPVVVRHMITVPDFWNLELQLSDLMLVSEVRVLNAPLKPRDQVDHPYTWGRAEVLPSASTTFVRDEVLSIVYQICNYGSPDTDLTAEYTFFRLVDGRRSPFNRTEPQHLTDEDLPPSVKWETQGFAMQRVPLKPFAPGDYELEVVVKDRLTRGAARQSIAFTVK